MRYLLIAIVLAGCVTGADYGSDWELTTMEPADDDDSAS
jgi:hypothetical protein